MLDVWVEAKKDEIVEQQFWKYQEIKHQWIKGRNAISEGESGQTLCIRGVHRIGMVACFISEIDKKRDLCPRRIILGCFRKLYMGARKYCQSKRPICYFCSCDKCIGDCTGVDTQNPL